MLLLAYLLTLNPAWRDASIVVKCIASNEMSKNESPRFLETWLPEIRIAAQIDVKVKPDDLSVVEIIHRESKSADIVFMGLAEPGRGHEETCADRLEELAGDLSCVFFVKNSSLFVGRLLQPSDDVVDTQEAYHHKH